MESTSHHLSEKLLRELIQDCHEQINYSYSRMTFGDFWSKENRALEMDVQCS
jgi:hypothetical protein